MSYYHGPYRPSFMRKVKQRAWVPAVFLLATTVLFWALKGTPAVVFTVTNAWVVYLVAAFLLSLCALMDRNFEDLIGEDTRPASGGQIFGYAFVCALHLLVLFKVVA